MVDRETEMLPDNVKSPYTSNTCLYIDVVNQVDLGRNPMDSCSMDRMSKSCFQHIWTLGISDVALGECAE